LRLESEPPTSVGASGAPVNYGELNVSIIMVRSGKDVIARPILSVVPISDGPDKGKYTLLAHGKNEKGDMCIVQLRVFSLFSEAAIVWERVMDGQLKAEDVPNFEVTPHMILTWRDKYLKS
jgi:hypothetical protein